MTDVNAIEQKFEKITEDMLKNKDIRYLCLVDKMGKLVSEKNKNEKDYFISDKKAKELYMKKKLETSLIKDFDNDLGKLNYVVDTREKIRILSIPVYGFLIIITTENNANCDLIAHSVIKLLSF